MKQTTTLMKHLIKKAKALILMTLKTLKFHLTTRAAEAPAEEFNTVA